MRSSLLLLTVLVCASCLPNLPKETGGSIGIRNNSDWNVVVSVDVTGRQKEVALPSGEYVPLFTSPIFDAYLSDLSIEDFNIIPNESVISIYKIVDNHNILAVEWRGEDRFIQKRNIFNLENSEQYVYHIPSGQKRIMYIYTLTNDDIQ